MQSVIINNSSDCYESVINILNDKFKKVSLKSYINIEDEFGNTAILYAAYRGNIHIVKSLINYGADANAKSKKGLNVLHMAAQGNNPHLIIYFKEKYNLSVESQDNAGNLPLHWACYNSSEEAINFLLSFMDNINVPNNEGKTPLHIAVFTEKPSLIKKLLKKGGKVNLKDKDGKTPITLAYELTGPSSKITNILLANKPKKSCLENFCRFSSNNREENQNSRIVLSPSIYLFTNITLWILLFFLQLDHIPNSFSVIFFIFIFIFLIIFIYMAFSDPGIIENVDSQIDDWFTLVNKDVNIKNMCPYCKVKRQRLSRHCFFCKKCIREQNCHCNILNNCIGEYNSNGYIFFLIMHIVLYGYIFYISFKVFLIPDVIYDATQFMLPCTFLYKKTIKDIMSIFFMTFSIICCAWSSFVCFKHVRQTIINSKIKELNNMS